MDILLTIDHFDGHCFPGDVQCLVNEALTNFQLDMIKWVLDAFAWALNLGSISPGTDHWDNGLRMTRFWGGIVTYAGLIAFTSISIGWGLVRQRREIIMNAVLGMIFAFPMTAISIWAAGELLLVVDQLTKPILEAATGGNDPDEQLRTFFGAQETLQDSIETVAKNVSPVSNISIILMAVAVFIIIAINMIRNIAVQVLIAIAPIVFMMLPAGFGKTVVLGWAKALAAAILTKPLMITYVALLFAGFRNATFFSLDAFPYIFGLLMVIFVPFGAFGIFNFFGQDDSHTQAASGVGGKLRSATRAVGRAGGSFRGAPTPKGGGSQPASSGPSLSSRSAGSGGSAGGGGSRGAGSSGGQGSGKPGSGSVGSRPGNTGNSGSGLQERSRPSSQGQSPAVKRRGLGDRS